MTSVTSQWPLRTLKVFGVLHIVFAAAGLYLALAAAELYVATDSFTKTGQLYEKEAFLLRVIISVVSLGILSLAGVSLLRGNLRGVTISNILFVSVILYLFLPLWGLFGEPFWRSMGATAGIGDVGLALLLVTGYPAIASLALNLARRRLKSAAK